VIVFVLPVAEQHFRLEQRVELLTVQELVTNDVRCTIWVHFILPGLTGQ
jgi:hypothetical protein